MIIATITLGTEYETRVSGKTIEEVLEKIKYFHTMSDFDREHYKKKNKLEEQLKTGWYLNES